MSLFRRISLIGLVVAVFLVSALNVAAVPAHAAVSVAGPVAQKWYFAEGRVGSGFRSFFTVDNPNSSVCAVKATYDYVLDGSTANQTKTVPYTIQPNSRYTINANASVDGPSTLAAIISVDSGATPTCSGIVVERPMYFNDFHGVSSGTEVLGATDAALNTTFYFADIATHSAGESFLSILNPGDVSANVSVVYYSGGVQVGATATLSVAPNSRGTIEPNADINLPAHVSAIVSSDHNVLVERPSYFLDEYGVSGSADVTGVSSLAPDWLFAEGNTSSGTQENLAIANLDAQPAMVTVALKSLNGAVWTSNAMTIAPKSQVIWNVNANNGFAGATSEVAAEVKSIGANIAVQRQMFSTYSGANSGQSWTSQGVSDAFGATTASNAYSFAEGFTSIGFNEWLLLQNPTTSAETINVTLVNMLGHTYTQSFSVPAQSRYTVNVTQMVSDHLINAGEDARAYAVSMSVTSSSAFVAERSIHWSAFGTQGTNSSVGYH